MRKGLHHFVSAVGSLAGACHQLGGYLSEFGQGQYAYDRPIYGALSATFEAWSNAIAQSAPQLERVARGFELDGEATLMGDIYRSAAAARPPFIQQANEDFVTNAATYQQNRLRAVRAVGLELSGALMAQAAALFEAASRMRRVALQADETAPLRDVARLY